MKKILLGLMALACSQFMYAQTVDEIVNKHIEAIGGKDAWMKVNSMVMNATMKAQGAEITLKFTVLNGKGSRQDFSFGGMTGYQIVTPTAGWNFSPFQGQKQAEPITADELKEGQEELDIQGTLINYKEKGHTIEYLGKDDIDGVDAFKLKETLKSGKVETIYIDPKDYFIMRVVSKRKANGQEMEVTQNMSNYQKLPQGIFVPMSMSGQGEITINKIEVNVPVDESVFKP
jgi:hypothetical protein